jgi:hypothetical protein
VTGVMHDIARAALPVAAALLVLAAAARVALWVDLDDEKVAYVARQYLAPLSTWCLGAVAVYAVALGAAGEAGVVPLALAAGIGGAAMLLRAPEEHAPQEAPRPVAEDPSRVQTRPLGDDVAAARAGGGLWLDPAEDKTRTGLWSR